MRSSIICLEKFNGALNFTILQLKFILNSLQNSSIMISAAKNIWFMYTSIVEENCYGVD